MTGLRLFKIGSYILILTAVFHFVGHFSGGLPPQNETEKMLMESIDTYQFEVGGLKRTTRQFLNGFSLFFGYALINIGVLNLLIARFAGQDVRILRVFILVNILFLGFFTMLSAIHFIYPPTICLGLALLIYMISACRSPRPKTIKDKG